MSFDEFSLEPRCLNVLTKQGITEPTPIQAQAIPPALEGRDVIAIAQTGTGKTLAFALPSLTALAAYTNARRTMLILTPTRELAQQVCDVITPLARPLGLRTACIYGGAGMGAQTDQLRRGCSIIVATPGRLLDHLNRGNVQFNHLEVLVLDEADRMLDMGFLPDIRRILAYLPDNRQTLMFSATFPEAIARLAKTMQREPVRIEAGPVAMPVDNVRQNIYTVAPTAKLSLLTQLLEQPDARSVLVFIRTKHRADRVAHNLHKAGFKVQAIHGDRSQRQREQALQGFRSGRYNVLVATDIAARGLDVQGISHVINFDIPQTSDEYVHRIGRTGRANTSGDAITFVTPEEYKELRTIESGLGKNLPRADWEGAMSVVSLFQPQSDRPAFTRHRGRSMFRRR